MAALTEGKYSGEFIVSEANGSRSREVVTVNESGVLVAGTVLSAVAAGGYKAYDKTAEGELAEAAAAILLAGVDATDGDVSAVAIVRDSEVALADLTGIDTAGVADLLALGIVCR